MRLIKGIDVAVGPEVSHFRERMYRGDGNTGHWLEYYHVRMSNRRLGIMVWCSTLFVICTEVQ